MRFQAQGPDIPLDLLEARDQGEVVFFCGAGVSMPAGLPDFGRLARQVIRDLHVPLGDPAEALFARAMAETNPRLAPPMDEVFGLLQADYGIANVEAAVARRLRTPPGADLTGHQTILRLSTDAEGRRRVVTTNFDPLFQRADRRLPIFVPPGLPDLGYAAPLAGLVHLHGRLDRRTPPRERQGLVLGTSDFGRAYLSEGWATRFIRQLLDRYTLVLLGYSADDPPVRYLLEGLHAGAGAHGSIYAFTEGAPQDVESRWRARGVTPIAYDGIDVAHSGLWRSLEAWADRADDPQVWRAGVLDLARRGPTALAAHERGQVAALVETPAGAKSFRDADPPPPAEWLCVFDAKIRYARPSRGFLGDGELFDPLATYGLDRDPPRPVGARREDPPPGANLLAPSLRESSGAGFAGLQFQRWAPLPPRLWELGIWCSRVMFQPATLWWAAQQHALHPELQAMFDRELRRPVAPGAADHAGRWRLLLEAAADLRDPRRDWYELRADVARDGWSAANLRELANVLRPRLIADRLLTGRPQPPATAVSLYELAQFDVKFQELPTAEIAFTHAALPATTKIWREALIYGASLLADTHPIGWRTPTLLFEDLPGGRALSDGGPFFLQFADLFARLADSDLPAARREIATWPAPEPFFFDKLRLWAWRRADLFTGNAVSDGLMAVDDDLFWRGDAERELLRTLRDRWSGFTAAARADIEARLVLGPLAWPDEAEADYAARRGREAAVRLGWLQTNGCELSEVALTALPALRAADPRWSPEWDAQADASHEGRVGWVGTDPSPGILLSAPLSEVISQAAAARGRLPGIFMRAEPFLGLLQDRPGRAISALGYEARKGRAPTGSWRTLLQARDLTLSVRQLSLVAARLTRLPPEVLADLRFEAPRWIETHLTTLAALDLQKAWRLWDAMSAALASSGPEATQSGIGDTSVGGVSLRLSRRTYDHAINGPVGFLTRAALAVFAARTPTSGTGVPEDIRQRLDAALTAPGEGADHALSILTGDLAWLDYVDPNYVRAQLAPRFDPATPNAEPAWSGYVHNGQPVRPGLFKMLKPAFLKAFTVAGDWRWADRHTALATLLISLRLPAQARYVTEAEVRTALQAGGVAACEDALGVLVQYLVQDVDWPAVRRVLRSWPLELRLQTPETSRQFVNLAAEAGDAFPNAVQVISPFLQQTLSIDLFRLTVGRDDTDALSLAARFPESTLTLLDLVVGPETQNASYDLIAITAAMAEGRPGLRLDPRWRRLVDLAQR
jgi:hypothetical protein